MGFWIRNAKLEGFQSTKPNDNDPVDTTNELLDDMKIDRSVGTHDYSTLADHVEGIIDKSAALGYH